MDFESLYNQLEEYILEGYGERCQDFEIHCEVCLQYMALDILANNIRLDKEIGES